jgi:hypothetical protein
VIWIRHGNSSTDVILALLRVHQAASPALRAQGYNSIAVFTTRLGLNDIILLE